MDSKAGPEGMRGKLKVSLALAKESIVFTKHHPKLLGFAAIAALACLVCVGLVALLGYHAYQYGLLPSFAPDADAEAAFAPSELALAGVFGFGVVFVCMMFQAIIIAAMRRIAGDTHPVPLKNRVPAILGWSLIITAVTITSLSIGEYLGLAGSIIDSVISFLWPLVTLFVIVLLVIERKSVLESLRGSFALFKEQWFVVIATSLMLGLFFLLAILLVVLLAVLAAVVLAGNGVLVGIAYAALALVFVLLALAFMTSSSVSVLVLYDYISTGKVPSTGKSTRRGTT